MSEIELTKDSDYLICLLYKGYLEARASGIPKSNAKQFGNSRMINDTYVPDWSFEDCLDTCGELHNAGFLDWLCGGNEIIHSNISDVGIIYMEGRFKKNVQSIVDHIKDIKAIFLF